MQNENENWFSSVDNMKALFPGHFFSPDTMRFFKSRVLETLYGKGRVFVTSEKDGDNPRRYTVRIAQWSPENDYDMSTVGDFQAFGDAHQAKAWASLVGRYDRRGLLPDKFTYGQDVALAIGLGMHGVSGRTDGWVFSVE